MHIYCEYKNVLKQGVLGEVNYKRSKRIFQILFSILSYKLLYQI